MLRLFLLLLLLTGLPAAPAGAQSSSTPVPPPSTGRQHPLPHAQVAAVILSHLSSADRNLLGRAWLLSVRQKLLMSWRPLLPDTTRPPMAEPGTVVLVVHLGSKGVVQGVRVVQSTGGRSLRKAAEGAVKSASPYPPFPSGLSARRLRLRVTFQYD